MRVLVVEDHVELAETVAGVLRREGMAVDLAFDGRSALVNAAVYDYDVIVLDRDLPELHGDEVCKMLVERGGTARILMLTASSTVADRVEGLGLGADDYLAKPFAFAELIARVRALARRAQPALPPLLVHDDLKLDTAQRQATRAGRRLELSRNELSLLEVLLAAQGPGPLGRRAAAARLGRKRRPGHKHGQGDDQPPARQARRPAADRDGARRLPHRTPMTRLGSRLVAGFWRRLPRRSVRLRLTIVYASLFVASGAGLARDHLRPRPPRPLPIADPANPAQPAVAGRCSRTAGRHALAARQHNDDLHQLLLDSGVALAMMAAASIGLGWLAAGRVLRPLRLLNERARAISASSLHKRLALSGPDDELSQLAGTFDDLLDRLEAAFAAQRRFVANASHELRTPLTLERALLEANLTDPDATIDSFRATSERLLALSHEQEQLTDALLTLASSERGLDRHEPFDLATLTDQALSHPRIRTPQSRPPSRAHAQCRIEHRRPAPRRTPHHQPPRQRHPPQLRRRTHPRHHPHRPQPRRPGHRQQWPSHPRSRTRPHPPTIPAGTDQNHRPRKRPWARPLDRPRHRHRPQRHPQPARKPRRRPPRSSQLPRSDRALTTVAPTSTTSYARPADARHHPRAATFPRLW